MFSQEIIINGRGELEDKMRLLESLKLEIMAQNAVGLMIMADKKCFSLKLKYDLKEGF